MGWEEVDEGWGARARDWAYLFESQWWPEFDEVLRRSGVVEGTSFMDVCCGSGLAAQMAGRRGANNSPPLPSCLYRIMTPSSKPA